MESLKDLPKMHESLMPVQAEIANLLTMFDFFLSQRQLGKPIEVLSDSVRDLRLILGRLLMDHFLGLTRDNGEQFCKAMAEMLADRCVSLFERNPDDEEYCRYCVGEIL
ncbi:MAG: hypothetical protein WC956_11210, partial [bacterium]